MPWYDEVEEVHIAEFLLFHRLPLIGGFYLITILSVKGDSLWLTCVRSKFRRREALRRVRWNAWPTR